MALTETGKSFPVYILILPGDEVFPVVLSGELDIDMATYAMTANDVAREMEAEAMMLICEQTMIARTNESEDLQDLLDGKLRPSEMPDKEDYLTMMYMFQDGQVESLISKIHSDPAGTRYTRDKKWIKEAVTSMITEWK
jgi:hypothetical protein